MQPITHCTAVILTGGESKRMGSDKARVVLSGKPMLEHITAQLEPLFSDILLSVRTERGDVSYPQILDDTEARAPMVGIKSALERVHTAWIFVIACDMPWVSTRLIQHLAALRSQHDAVVPEAFDRPQPLFGFYHKNCLPQMEERIKQGQRSMMRLLDDLDSYVLGEQQVKAIDPTLRSLVSLNSMNDVKKAERLNG